MNDDLGSLITSLAGYQPGDRVRVWWVGRRTPAGPPRGVHRVRRRTLEQEGAMKPALNTREALALIGPRRGLKLTYYARELSSVGKNDEEGMRRAVARARAFAAVLWGYGWSTLRMDYCGACESRSVLEIIGERSNP